MDKKKIIIIVIIIVLCIGAVVAFLIFNKKPIDIKIKDFKYNYGGYPGEIYHFHIYTKGGKTYFELNGMNGVKSVEEKEVNDSVLSDIGKIINDNKIYEWNGFNETDLGFADGSSFKLNVEYENGEKISAKGNNSFPKDYYTRHKKLADYLEKMQ